jgi:hypothetical protein
MDHGIDYMTRGMRRQGGELRSRRCPHCAWWRLAAVGAALVLALLWTIDYLVVKSGIAG